MVIKGQSVSDIAWHHCSADKAAEQLKVDPSLGLSSQEVIARSVIYTSLGPRAFASTLANDGVYGVNVGANGTCFGDSIGTGVIIYSGFEIEFSPIGRGNLNFYITNGNDLCAIFKSYFQNGTAECL